MVWVHVLRRLSISSSSSISSHQLNLATGSCCSTSSSLAFSGSTLVTSVPVVTDSHSPMEKSFLAFQAWTWSFHALTRPSHCLLEYFTYLRKRSVNFQNSNFSDLTRKKSKIPIWPVVIWREKTTIQNDSLIRCAWQKRRSGCFGDFFNIGIIGNAIFAVINLFLTPLQNQWICFQFFILLTSFTAANGARWSGAGSRMAFISFEMTSFGTASIHSKMLSVSTFGSVHDDATVLRHGKIDWTKSIVSFSLFFFVGEQNVNWFWPGKNLCQNILTICFERVAGKFK